jgi:hypothetical protein
LTVRGLWLDFDVDLFLTAFSPWHGFSIGEFGEQHFMGEIILSTQNIFAYGNNAISPATTLHIRTGTRN